MEDLLKLAIREADRLGAEYAEARYQRDVSETVILKNGVPEISARSVDEGICIRVLVDGGLGFASTCELNSSAARSIARSAVSLAKASAKLIRNQARRGEDLEGAGRGKA